MADDVSGGSVSVLLAHTFAIPADLCRAIHRVGKEGYIKNGGDMGVVNKCWDDLESGYLLAECKVFTIF